MRDAPVSVVIPFADNRRYLEAAIRSVLGQTLPPRELILVDDGSTDGSASVARRHVPPARYVRRDNGGAGAARNTGVARATQDFLAFCDADDLWLPAKLERQLAAIAADPGAEAVFAGVSEFRAGGGPPGPAPRAPRSRLPGALPSALLIRRAAFARVGAFAEGWRVGEWADWYTRAQAAGLRATWLSEVLVARRLHAANHGLRDPAARLEYARIVRAHLHRRREAPGAAP
jgi:glycosyltransferase involved in cell wall biosynthesis